MSIYMALACGGSLALGRVGWLRLLVVPLLFAVVSGGVLGLLLQQGWQPVEPVSILAMAASFPLVAGWGRRRRRTSRIDPRWTGDEPKWPVEP
jgi:hypothetical protein